MAEINKKILKQIGLTDNEIEVYLTLLRLGSSPVATIAGHSKIYRPYVYDTLKRLEEKGLVNSVMRQGKRYFQAIHPEKLMEYLKEKERALESILPSLINLIKIPKEETNVELYKGKEVIRIVQRDVLKNLKETREESLVIGVDEKRFMEADAIIMQQFFNQIKRYGLKEKVLVREGDNYLPAHLETTEYRFLPKEHFTPTSTFIYGDKIAVIIFSEPLYGLIIESKLLSDAYRKQFYLLWKVAKRTKPKEG